MRTLPLFVAISVFSIIVLFTPGCFGMPVSHEWSTSDAGMPAIDARSTPRTPPPTSEKPLIPLPLETPPMVDAGILSDATVESQDVPVFLDIPSTEEDASSTTTEDDVLDTDRPAPLPTEPVAFLLAPSTCHGRRLPATTPGLELGARGMTLWHLCYKTPTRTTSTHPLAAERPERVTLEVVLSDGERLLFAAPAPASANPWTVSLLVALPIGVAPAFQGHNYYNRNRELGIVASSDGEEFPSIQGEMRSWRVLRDQSQDEYVPARVCRRPTPLRPDGAFFLPLDMCPGRTCPLLERLDCRVL